VWLGVGILREMTPLAAPRASKCKAWGAPLKDASQVLRWTSQGPRHRLGPTEEIVLGNWTKKQLWVIIDEREIAAFSGGSP